jgi:hypothetical protein
MAMGQRMLDRRVLKIESKRSKDQWWCGTFFGSGSQEEGRKKQQSPACPAFCSTCYSQHCGRNVGGGSWLAHFSVLSTVFKSFNETYP